MTNGKEFVIRKNQKIAFGTIVTIIIFLLGTIFGVIRWCKKTDENIAVIKRLTKDNSKAIEALEKCGYDFNADMAVVKNEIDNIKKDLKP